MVITLSKADPIGKKEIQNMFINISSDLPKHETLEDSENYYEAQAVLLESALHNVLPQAVYERLIIKSMERKTSLYRGTTNTVLSRKIRIYNQPTT